MQELLQTGTTVLWAAVVSAVVSVAVTYYFRKREIRYGLLAAYEHEQVKEIRALIGRFHGRLLQAAFSLNNRMWNLYANQDRGWLAVRGQYASAGYYFNSMVYRYLSVLALVRRFESEAIYLDARLARSEDFVFMNYLSAFFWCATDSALFKGLPYDIEHCTDHFFSDSLRSWSDSMWADAQLQPMGVFEQRIGEDASLAEPLSFFDGLRRGEDRYRWDRMVALHLLLLAFVNRFGYPTQHSSFEHFVRAAEQAEHPEALQNLVAWLGRLGLADDEGAVSITKAVSAVEK